MRGEHFVTELRMMASADTSSVSAAALTVIANACQHLLERLAVVEVQGLQTHQGIGELRDKVDRLEREIAALRVQSRAS